MQFKRVENKREEKHIYTALVCLTRLRSGDYNLHCLYKFGSQRYNNISYIYKTSLIFGRTAHVFTFHM